LSGNLTANVLLSPGECRRGGLELWQHAPSPSGKTKLSALPPSKAWRRWSLEIDRQAIAVARRTARDRGPGAPAEARALLAQDLDGPVDRRIVDLDLRSLDARGAEVAELHLRINLEGRAELERLSSAAAFFSMRG